MIANWTRKENETITRREEEKPKRVLYWYGRTCADFKTETFMYSAFARYTCARHILIRLCTTVVARAGCFFAAKIALDRNGAESFLVKPMAKTCLRFAARGTQHTAHSTRLCIGIRSHLLRSFAYRSLHSFYTYVILIMRMRIMEIYALCRTIQPQITG